MDTQLAVLQREREQKAAELHALFTEHLVEKDGVKVYDFTAEQLAEVNRRNDELTEIGKKVDAAAALAAAADRAAAVVASTREVERKTLPQSGKADAPAFKSLGTSLALHPAFKQAGRMVREVEYAFPEADLKTLFETTAGWAPETPRNRPLVLDAQRPLQVSDLLPQRQVTSPALTWMEETTFTNNAAEVLEGGTYGEAALALTERSSAVRKIGTWLPVTDEQMADVAGIGSYIDSRLTFMLQQRLDRQILQGTGVAPQVVGVLNQAGIQTQAKGADPTPDAIYKAADLVRVTGRAVPGALVIHPNDWQDIRLLRTADGIYIWGSPADAGPQRIWGHAVVLSDALTENTAVIGDWGNFAELAYMAGITIKATDSHDTNFITGRQAIRADVRVLTVWYRPAAFCTITGI